MQNLQNEMWKRWKELWQAIGTRTQPGPVFDNLVERYSEPHRAYHVLGHIYHSLLELDKVWDITPNPEAVAVALWFHDAVYDTKSKDSEERSALLAREVLEATKVDPEFIAAVERLILATKHAFRPVYLDEQAMVDSDLSILGQIEPVFDEYELQVRREYNWVPEPDFKTGRSEILEGFLQRDRIFSTEYFYKLYEQQAQQNLQRSLDRLR